MLPDAFSRLGKMHLDEGWIVKAAPTDAFSRPRKMHLDERWILKAAPRRSMLPDAFSRARKMHLDKRWGLEAAPRSSMLPDAFPGFEKSIWTSGGFSRQLLEGACSQMRFPGPEKCI